MKKEETALLAPPIPNEVAFYCRFFAEVSSIRDEAGRPLHEVDFRQELNSDDVRRCPYSGSRHGYLMNQTALNGVIKEWKKLKAGMSALVRSVPVAARLTDGRTRTWVRSLLPMFLPLFILRKTQRCGRGVVLPTEASNLFKVMLDVPTTIDLMLARDWSLADMPSHDSDYSASDIAQYAEDSGILNNGEWTCAGPPRLIEEILMLFQSPQLEADEGSQIANILNRERGFLEFSLIMIQQYALSQAFQTTTAYLMEQAFQRLPAHTWTNQAIPGASHPPAYDMRRQILLGSCYNEESTLRVVGGFIDTAAELDSLLPSPTSLARTGLAPRLLQTISAVKAMDSAQQLNNQLELENELRHAVLIIHNRACQAVGTNPDEHLTDFAFFNRPDFPTVVLKTLIQEAYDA